MALIVDTGECIHCEEPITLRRYASGSWDNSSNTVDLWVTGSGAFPGDQRICESNILDDDIGSYGRHEPKSMFVRTELTPILLEMDVPKLRLVLNDENVRWLRRNLGINNSGHKDFSRAMELLDQLPR